MRNWYIADTHFGHCNVIRFDGRPSGMWRKWTGF